MHFMTPPLEVMLTSVSIYMVVYQFFNDYTPVAIIGKVGTLKHVNHTNKMTTVVPKSVLYRCVIKYYCDIIDAAFS